MRRFCTVETSSGFLGSILWKGAINFSMRETRPVPLLRNNSASAGGKATRDNLRGVFPRPNSKTPSPASNRKAAGNASNASLISDPNSHNLSNNDGAQYIHTDGGVEQLQSHRPLPKDADSF